MIIKGRLVHAFYRSKPKEMPMIYMVVRDLDGNKKFIDPIPSPFRPYFYIETKDLSIVAQELERILGVGGYNFVPTDLDFALAEGKAMKVEIWEPWRINQLKKHFRQGKIDIHEADVPFIRRIKIDLGIKSGIEVNTLTGEMKPYDEIIPSVKKLYIDIEVDDSNGFPEEAGEYRILCIGTTNDKGEERYFTWTQGRTTEANMLTEFYEYAKEYGYLVVWNKGFEEPHITKRAKNLNVWKQWRIFQWIDLAEYWKMFNLENHFEKLPNAYERVLKKFGKKLGNLGVVKYDKLDRLAGYYNAWKNNPSRMEEVNLSHAYALYVIEKAIEVISLYDGVADEVGIFLSYAHYNSHIVDTLAMRFNEQALKKWVIPSSGDYSGKGGGFKGAVVFPAQKGVHPFVFLFDFTSLYNKIIQGYLLDPIAYYHWDGTFTEDGVDKYIEYARSFGHVYGVEVDEIDKVTGEVTKIRLPIFPAILHTMEIRRNELKAKRKLYAYGTDEYEYYESKQKAAKVILLACYGVLGMTSSRWNVVKQIPKSMIVWNEEDGDFRVTGLPEEKLVGMVTHVARLALEGSKDFFDADEHIDVIYGDTDSDFVTPVDLVDKSKTYIDLTKEDMKILQDFGFLYADKLAEYFSGKFEAGIEMKLEKIFDRGIWGGAKKQYYCRTIWDEDSGWQLDDDGNLTWYEYTKGLPLIRTDRTPFLKRTQKAILNMILDNPKGLKKLWTDIADDFYQNKNDHELILRIGVKKRLDQYSTKTVAVRAAQKIIDAGGKIRPGEKVAFVVHDIVNKKPDPIPIDEDLDPMEAIKALPSKITRPALDYYWNKRVWKNIQPFLELVLEDVEILEITNAQKGLSLIDKWF